MKDRVNRPKKGSIYEIISYDPKWESFENFLRDMGPRPEGLTLERQDNFGPYCKSNCIWADRFVQMNNCNSGGKLAVLRLNQLRMVRA